MDAAVTGVPLEKFSVGEVGTVVTEGFSDKPYELGGEPNEVLRLHVFVLVVLSQL